jgi:glyoxylase I family protein
MDLSLKIAGVHHLAIICSNYEKSRRFYSEILDLAIISETYRADRGSYKIDLALPDGSQIELFSFPDSPPRASYPEACGLRHLAFAVQDLDDAVAALADRGVPVENVRVDKLTGKRFTFFADPDGLPLELYEERG